MTASWRPLEGITILDLTRMLPGGTATLLLADLGATVLKVEQPGEGDGTRWLAPRVGDDSSVQHQYMDRGKVTVRADLKTAEGLATVFGLAAGADAVIESFRPGVADRLGIGFEALVAIRPDLVFVSLTGYGQSGPRAAFAGHDLNFVGYAGIIDGPLPGVMSGDISGGMIAALGILAGVLESRRTGTPAHIDIALADAALLLGGPQISEVLGAQTLGEAVVTPLDGSQPCYNTYRCADDKWLAVGALEPKFWVRTCELLEHPEWVARQADPSLVPEFASLIASRNQSEWAALLEESDTCVSPVLPHSDLLNDEHTRQRGSVALFPSAAGPLWQVASPFRRMDV